MRARMIRWVLPLVVVGVAGVGTAMAATASTDSSGGTVNALKSSTFGMVLAGSNGRTLYRYTLDRKGVNACTGACAKLWPPLLVKATAKPTAGGGALASLLGTISAAQGMRIVTYAGFPLHLFSGDTKAGQTKGQGFSGKWFVVNSKGALVKHAVATTGGTTTKSSWG